MRIRIQKGAFAKRETRTERLIRERQEAIEANELISQRRQALARRQLLDRQTRLARLTPRDRAVLASRGIEI
ncbi:MAG: hypothetical protein FJ267_20490 [Planctomycetes bacterium]|nr:hypothetical protein [Planctomycetota bacterium]